MKKNKKIKQILSVLVCLSFTVLCFAGCKNGAEPPLIPESENLMAGVQRGENTASYDFTQEVQPLQAYEKYTQTLTDFSATLLKGTAKDTNTLLSPVSVYLSLAMAANGANGQSLKEFKKVLGSGVISVDNINGCSDYLLQRLTAFNSDKASLSIANSLWVRDGIDVKRTFLQKNANYYGADAFTEDFSNEETIHKINGWVKEQTNGAVENIVKSMDAQTFLYLVSTLALDAPWTTAYTADNVKNDVFHAPDGEKTVQFMQSEERYIKSDSATGFIKNLDTLPLRFVAILPNEEFSLDEYAGALTGGELTALMTSATATDFALASLPVFSYTYEQNMTQVLENAGLEGVFTTRADFQKMTSESVYISGLAHKTYIDVGPQGVKAGAAASAEMTLGTAFTETRVVLDRPFLYMLVDNESNIPVLIGAVTNP